MAPTTPGIDTARLLRAVRDGPFDQHAALVRRMLASDASLVTVIDGPGASQQFLGLAGLPEPIASQRITPVELSMCQVVMRDRKPLMIEDMDRLAWTAAHPLRTQLGIHAYAGLPLRTPDGTTVGAVCAASLRPRSWSSEDVSRLEMLRDFIEIDLVPVLEAADARERADEVSLLLSTLRHELSGELTIVLGGIETAQLSGVPQLVHDRVLHNARRETNRVIATLDSLLRTDTRAPMRLREADAAEVVAGALESIELDAGHRVVLDVAPVRTVTEPTLLASIVSNLVANAHKYSVGPVRVSGVWREDGAFGIAVQDEGPGFPEAALRQLFEPFTRGHPEDARGFGLGLYIVRMLCDRLGAELTLDTSAEGSTLCVWLPEASENE